MGTNAVEMLVFSDTAYTIFSLMGGTEIIAGFSMLRLLMTEDRVEFVAVAVSTITLTFSGRILLISPKLENSRRKPSPLQCTDTCYTTCV